jgi:hypothetical protein
MNEEQGLIKISSGLLAALSKGQLNLQVFKQDILVLQCIVAGTSHQALDSVESSLRGAVKLEVVREANNQFDPFAVALHFQGVKIGYVPRDKNEVIARLLDAGKTFFAVIQASDREGKWLKLDVRVFIQD